MRRSSDLSWQLVLCQLKCFDEFLCSHHIRPRRNRKHHVMVQLEMQVNANRRFPPRAQRFSNRCRWWYHIGFLDDIVWLFHEPGCAANIWRTVIMNGFDDTMSISIWRWCVEPVFGFFVFSTFSFGLTKIITKSRASTTSIALEFFKYLTEER